MNASKIAETRRRLRPSFSVRWRGGLILAIPIVCLFASILAIAGLRSQLLAVMERQEQSQQTISDLHDLLTTLLDAEAGVRGYVITKRPEFLQAYLKARTELPKSLGRLSAQVQAEPTQHQKFQAIPLLTQQQIKLSEQILKTSDLQSGATTSSPLLVEQLLKSQSNMDNLRQEIAAFTQQEKRIGRDRASEALWWQRLTNTVEGGALVVGLVGAIAAYYLFNQLNRNLAERASRLRESNVYLRAVFNNVVDGIIILNDRGYIQSANAAALDIFGYDLDEVLGKHLQRLIAESFTDDSGKVLNSLVGHNQDKLRLQQETIGRHKQGKTFPMEFAISQMQLDNEHLFIAIMRDITHRKQSSETLLKQAHLLDLANDTIMVRDLNDRITYWNQGAERMYGWSVKEARGKLVHTLLETEFPQPLEEIEAALYKDGFWHGELGHSRRNGTRLAVASGWTLQRDEMGKPVACLEINQDITARQQAEVALRHSEKLYRTLVNNFPNGAVFLFDQDLRYNVAGGTGLTALNLDGATLTGKTIGEILPPQSAQILAPIYHKALEGKATVTELAYASRLYRVHVLPVTNEAGDVVSGMMMTQDITETKRAEAALRSRADELARMTAVLAQTTASLEKRNAELDQFAYIVSHDLKAPLRAITNLSQWLEEDIADQLTQETQHQMDLLRSRVHRMEALIDGLLQYSRVGRLRTELEPVDVEALLALVIDSLAPPPEFTITVEPEMPTLFTERLPLEQVFTNLISNSIKHHPQPDGQIVISVAEHPDFYEFAVADDGPGIAPEFHEKIFVMFQTLEARDKVENTGVGLAIVKKIIEDKGGSISLESQLGQGTTFRFTWSK